MGLAGRKVKQRIAADPRNLAWADDAAKFGLSYLSKFGWDSSKGLGVDGDGRKSHIKVSHKLDMLGIGAAHQNGSNGVSWKQNRDFESVLQRLYEASEQETPPSPDAGATKEGSEQDTTSDIVLIREKKRKREKRSESEQQSLKKRKKNKDIAKTVQDDGDIHNVPVKPPPPFTPRARAHRARSIASKTIASKSAASIAEILGIAPASSLTASDIPSTSSGGLTPISDDNASTEKLTTSTQSVGDYFKEKLLEKSLSFSTTTPPLTPDNEAAYDDTPRRGIGNFRSHISDILSVVTHQPGIVSSKLSCTMSSTSFPADPASQDAAENLLLPAQAKTGKVKRKKERSKDKQTLEEDKVEQPKRKEKKALRCRPV